MGLNCSVFWFSWKREGRRKVYMASSQVNPTFRAPWFFIGSKKQSHWSICVVGRLMVPSSCTNFGLGWSCQLLTLHWLPVQAQFLVQACLWLLLGAGSTPPSTSAFSSLILWCLQVQLCQGSAEYKNCHVPLPGSLLCSLVGSRPCTGDAWGWVCQPWTFLFLYLTYFLSFIFSSSFLLN